MIAFSISPSLNGYDTRRSVTLIDQLRERFATLPGVRAVASSELPVLTGTDMGGNITVERGEKIADDVNHVQTDAVSPGYFSTLGIALVSGREFNAGDKAGAPKVAVINEALAKKYFGQRDPIGMHAAFGGGKVTPDILIVGVVKNDKQDHVRSELAPFLFVPYAQREDLYGMSFYVRTQQDPLLLASEIRDGVRSIDPNLPVYDLKTFNRVVDEDLLAERLIAGMSAGFGILAGVLAALGIYGVLAYLVVQRTREIGIRMALGAATHEVRSLILKEVGFMVIAGCAVGLPVAYGFARLSQSLLFGVKANSFDIYLLALAVIAIVAAVACYLPVRRATRVDPIIALRYE